MEAIKAPVSLRSLLERLNRVLVKDGLFCKKARPGHAMRTLGTFYMTDAHTHEIQAVHVDPVALAADRKILKPWEELVS